jgi:energy-coupling factor transporter ATP-binding protein EcfA2
VNPFATRFVRPDQNRYRFTVDPLAESHQFAAFLSQLFELLRRHRRAAIVGPHGTGKTTLLRSIDSSLHDQFERVTTLGLSSERHHSHRELITAIDSACDTPLTSQCLVVDGFEQLRWWDRTILVREILKRPGVSLIVTSHRRHWRVPVCWQTQWNDELSRLLTHEKLRQVPDDLRIAIWQRFENRLGRQENSSRNLRDLWFMMYDDYEAIMADERQMQ